MAKDILSTQNFTGGAGITGLPAGANTGEPVTFEQLNAISEGIAWKDSVRAASTANVTVASPGASLDGITLATNDRILLKNQTAPAENGIYVWNGSAVPATRAADMNLAPEFESAVASVEEGTANGGTTWRQTAVNLTVGTTAVAWVAFGTVAPAASETVAGIAEIATQAETDTGTDDVRMVTPLKLATYAGRAKRFAADVGDASATSIAVNHNLNTRDCIVRVRKNAGNYDDVECDIQRTSVNQVTLVFAAAPSLNGLRVIVIA